MQPTQVREQLVYGGTGLCEGGAVMDRRMLLVLLMVLGIAGANKQPCADLLSVSLENPTEVFDNGSVLFDGLVFPNDTQYWDEQEQLRGCPCMIKRCIRLCCQPGEYMDKLDPDLPGMCYKSLYNDSLDYLDLPPLPDEVVDPSITGYEDFYRIHRKGCWLTSPFGYYLSEILAEGVEVPRITADGRFVIELINVEGYRTNVSYEQERFCLAYSGLENSTKIVACPRVNFPADVASTEIADWFKTLLNWLSVPFLIATFAVYALFSSLRNLYGKTLMSYVMCLVFAYIFQPVIRHKEFLDLRHRSCKILGPARTGDSVARDARLAMLRLLALQLLLLFGDAPVGAFLLANETRCPTEALVDLTESFANGSAINGSSVEVDGVFYPRDAIQWIEDRALGCPCRSLACLPLCCSQGSCLEPLEPTSEAPFFEIYDSRSLELAPDFPLGRFRQFAWNPCHGGDRYFLEPESKDPDDKDDKFKLLSNGSVYQPSVRILRNYTDFCVDRLNGTYRIILCFDETIGVGVAPVKGGIETSFPLGMLISVPFLLATLVVYMLIPELRNIHGQTLCGYVFSLVVAYVALSSLQIVTQDSISNLACSIYAYIVHFSFLASFFWLNVMCFDIWWTFGGFRSLHGSVKQRDRKKFIMYSIYAWGCATTLTIFCIIMDLVPGIPEHIIRPEFGKSSCWYATNRARALYFYLPMGLTVLCNICLFILTAHKILMHKKDTARQLKGSDSKRHDDNKQWFNLYLKLFIVMGINWSMEIVSWLFEGQLPDSVWYITDLTNTLQGVIIFIIFVWKDKIKRLLMKRFGCQGNFLSRNSTTRSGCPTSTASRTTCITQAPMHEKSNPYADSYRGKSTVVTDESDCI